MSNRQKSERNSISFSDQITSRLRNWVRGTTLKTRNNINDKERVKKGDNPNVRLDNCDVRRERKAKKQPSVSRNPRSMQELEDALKDLIENCVTNTVASSSTTSDEADSGSYSGSEVNQPDICTIGEPSDANKSINNRRKASRKDSDLSIHVDDTTDFVVIEECDGRGFKQSGHSNERSFTVLAENNASKDYIGNDMNRNLNHASNDQKTIDTLVSNVNNGLKSGNNNIKTKLNKSVKSSYNIGGNGKRTAEGDVERPPLRRIQSEGDNIVTKMTFKDSDVDAFAETCIRHAQQKKRLSEVGPEETYDPDFFSKLRSANQVLEQRKISSDSSSLNKSSQESLCSSRNDPSSQNTENVFNLSGHGLPKDDECLKETSFLIEEKSLSHQNPEFRKRRSASIPKDGDHMYSRSEGIVVSSKISPLSPRRRELPSLPEDAQHGLRASYLSVLPEEHRTASNRPGSQSLPRDFNHSGQRNQKRTVGMDDCSKSLPSSPKQISQQFRKFPHQPMFYVPESDRNKNIRKKQRQRSLTDSNKEFLI